MTTSIRVTQHYEAGLADGSLVDRVRGLLSSLGGNAAAMQQLAPLDHFHMRGPLATQQLAAMVPIEARWRVLDAGAGLGGPSRYLAGKFGCHVTGLDLSPQFVAVARFLAELSGLHARLSYGVGDCREVPVPDGTFDLVWSEHVVMNIPDRVALYREFRRVLKPGGSFAFYDAVSSGTVAPVYPMPWAQDAASSHILSWAATESALADAGFVLSRIYDASDEAKVATAAGNPAGPAPGPNLGVVMGPRMGAMSRNLADNVWEGRVRLMMGVAVHDL